VKASVGHVDLCLDVLSDMLQHSLFDEAEIEKEKGVIIEEINLYEDMPNRKIGDVYEELLYGDTPMGWDIAGTKGVIRSVTRQHFIDYLASLYSSDNLTVVVAGGIDEDRIRTKVEELFGGMGRFSTITAPAVVEKQEAPGVLLRTKKTEQVQIAMGYRTVGIDHADDDALEVLAAALGGGMSSRLFTEIREKRGLAYSVRTYSDQYRDCGSLVSLAGIDPKRVEEAITVMKSEYERLLSDQGMLTDEELQRAKEYLKGHQVLEFEDSRTVGVTKKT
jgi:predicted Zn-dependent peptidase